MAKVKDVFRTGRKIQAGSEFIITMTDGTQHTLWSPVWHEMDEEEETIAATDKAKELHETDD